MVKFAYNFFKFIFLNNSLCILIWISLKFTLNIPIKDQVMA